MATKQTPPAKDNDAPTVADIAAVTDQAPAKELPEKLPAEARVRAVRNPTYHLLTGELIPSDSDKKIKLDDFAKAQLRAGKWELVD